MLRKSTRSEIKGTNLAITPVPDCYISAKLRIVLQMAVDELKTVLATSTYSICTCLLMRGEQNEWCMSFMFDSICGL